MQSLGNLVSDQLAQQASGMNPKLKASTEKLGKALAARERDETVQAARSAPFSRVPLWSFYLPITRRQMLVLGRVFSFQCSTNKDRTPGEYRMSLANGGDELCIDRRNFKRDIDALTALGFIAKRSNGERRPATYLVDEVVCMSEARRNGYPG